MKLFYILFFIFASACAGSINIPKFAVKNLTTLPVKTTTAVASVALPFALNTQASNLTKSDNLNFTIQAINCSTELATANAAPQLIRRGQGYPLPLRAHEAVARFYADNILYDCEVRQRAEESAIIEKPRPSKPADSIYTSNYVGAVPKDHTVFVSWTTDFNNSNAQGKLVNLRLQTDGIRTKMRVDLAKVNGAKTLNSLLYLNEQNPPAGRPAFQNFYIKSIFKEIVDSQKVVTEHYIAGRHYNHHDKALITVVASMRKDKGMSVWFKSCLNLVADTPVNTLNVRINQAVCPLTSADVFYYNKNGVQVTSTEAGTLGLLKDFTVLESMKTTNFYSSTLDAHFINTFTPQ